MEWGRFGKWRPGGEKWGLCGAPRGSTRGAISARREGWLAEEGSNRARAGSTAVALSGGNAHLPEMATEPPPLENGGRAREKEWSECEQLPKTGGQQKENEREKCESKRQRKGTYLSLVDET